jgi:hypothetical protein
VPALRGSPPEHDDAIPRMATSAAARAREAIGDALGSARRQATPSARSRHRREGPRVSGTDPLVSQTLRRTLALTVPTPQRFRPPLPGSLPDPIPATAPARLRSFLCLLRDGHVDSRRPPRQQPDSSTFPPPMPQACGARSLASTGRSPRLACRSSVPCPARPPPVVRHVTARLGCSHSACCPLYSE